MFIYNVTIGIDREDEAAWVAWMKQEHIRKVMGTGMFIKALMYKILHDTNQQTVSYSIQYEASDLQDVIRYLELYAQALMEEHRQKFSRHVAYRTVLEEV
jgi:hypothetical protein